MLRFILISVVMFVMVGCASPFDAKAKYIEDTERYTAEFNEAFNTTCKTAFETNGVPFLRAIYNPITVEGLNACVSQLEGPMTALQALKPPTEYAEWHKRMLATNSLALVYFASVADAASKKDVQALQSIHKPVLLKIPEYPWTQK